jgi:fibronectin type III domain protein
MMIGIPHPLLYKTAKAAHGFLSRGSGFVTTTLLLALVTFTGCAVPGATQAPSLNIPKLVGDLKAVRKGETVTLTWTKPSETTDGELIRKPGKMLVQRALSSGPNSELQFQTISEQPLEPALKDDRSETATAKDSIAELLRSGGADFAVYTVLAQGNNGKSFGLPNRSSVPLVPTLPPPQNLLVRPAPSGILLHWDEFAPATRESRLRTQYAYKVMRQLQGAKDAVMVKQLDAGNGGTEFLDAGIEWEKNYQYWVTPVTLWQDNNRKGEVEGNDSAIVNVFAHDSFPPAAPSGLEAVFTAGQNAFIDLTWTANTENDLAGYNIYRHMANEAPVKINTELIKTPRFPDPGIQPGMKYFYSVTAIDVRGNESGKSAETSEIVPKE